MTIYRAQSINVEDVILREQYYNRFFSGDVEGAHDIYRNNTQLNGKVINATMLNQLLNAILNLEIEFITNVNTYLTNLTYEFQIDIDELIYMQSFLNTTQYEVNNFVLYNDNVYFCIKKPPVGTLPEVIDYWILLGLKGDKGSPSLGINYQGIWSNLKNYNTRDMVVYNNELYVSKIDNNSSEPTNNDEWFKALTVKLRGMFYNTLPDDGFVNGDIVLKDI